MTFKSPMLCEKLSPDEAKNLSSSWVVEQKFDGIRAIIIGSKLFDRRGKDITNQFPEFEGVGSIASNIILDGEIVAQSGDFNDVAGRVHLKDKFQIRLLSRKSPAIFMVFDAPHVVETLENRRAELLDLEIQFPKWIKVVPQYSINDIGSLWSDVLRNGDEGLVVKHKDSFYEWGCRSQRWFKVKAFQETVAEFVKYEVHNKGITIETKDGRRVVINGKQADEVVQRFKSSSSILAEIQYLPQKESSAWRFPSFRGLAQAQVKGENNG